MPINLPDYVKPDIPHQVGTALAEDVGSGDITALLIPTENQSSATIVTREETTVCGLPWVEEVFRQLPGNVDVEWFVKDGQLVDPDTVLCRLHGDSRAILTGERTALNFLQTLSGTATQARSFADAAAGAGNIRILDTRKTIPGLRTAQKYAVLCGGCGNHRLGLFDEFLIKENHIMACGSIRDAILRARELATEKPVVVEVESMAELRDAIAARPERVMLDDFSETGLSEALAIIPGHIDVEISGNVSLEKLGRIAAEFPVYVSVGALTKHVRAIDMSLRLEATKDG